LGHAIFILGDQPVRYLISIKHLWAVWAPQGAALGMHMMHGAHEEMRHWVATSVGNRGGARMLRYTRRLPCCQTGDQFQ